MDWSKASGRTYRFGGDVFDKEKALEAEAARRSNPLSPRPPTPKELAARKAAQEEDQAKKAARRKMNRLEQDAKQRRAKKTAKMAKKQATREEQKITKKQKREAAWFAARPWLLRPPLNEWKGVK